MPVNGTKQIAGVDGCKHGQWIAVITAPEEFGLSEIRMFESFAKLMSELAACSIIAVDMPIGLPERTIAGGREPDWLARAFLGPRKASVFPVPSRGAVYAYERGYAEVREIAQDTSDPPRKPSRQVFEILPRIQEIDEILGKYPQLRERVFEVHPEVSFQVMNNNSPLPEPKKVNGQPHERGLELREELLAKKGFAPSFLEKQPPPKAARDDFYDACACVWSAKRILSRKARVFPSHPPLDEKGLEQAIRA